MALSDNMRGALLMMGAMGGFTCGDAFMKVLGRDIPLMQLLTLRGLFVVTFLGWLTWWMGQMRSGLSRRDWGLVLLRSVAELAAAVLFMIALFRMEIGNLSAIMQSLPLTVTLAGALFFGERVGWKRLSAILVGFGGVLLIVQPGGAGFNVYALYALASVAVVTVRDLSARRMSRQVPSVFVAWIAAVVVLVGAGAASAFETWAPLTATHGWLIAGASGFVIVGYILSVSSMRVGEIGFVAPFRYTSLVVALILGAVVFDTFPDRLTLIGAGIVVATGLFTLLREWQLRRRGAAGGTRPWRVPTHRV